MLWNKDEEKWHAKQFTYKGLISSYFPIFIWNSGYKCHGPQTTHKPVERALNIYYHDECHCSLKNYMALITWTVVKRGSQTTNRVITLFAECKMWPDEYRDNCWDTCPFACLPLWSIVGHLWFVDNARGDVIVCNEMPPTYFISEWTLQKALFNLSACHSGVVLLPNVSKKHYDGLTMNHFLGTESTIGWATLKQRP